MKTSELIDLALDWAVATCEGWKYNDKKKIKEFKMQQISSAKHCYSTVWAKGGPIIEREKIQLLPSITSETWNAACPNLNNCIQVTGPTPLVAAMRCYVASKLGDKVDIPEEL